jgi:hypothetical protein
MRAVCCGLLFITLGCASTVTRLDGEFPAPIGPARGPCEEADWLVVAPTRVQFVEPSGLSYRGTELLRSAPRDDGVALYKVGAKHPEPIPAYADTMHSDLPSVDQHVDTAHSYDTKSWAAAGLGAAGLIAIGVGVGLFVASFKTDAQGQQKIDGTEAGIGAGLTLGGFGLGIAGLALNPGQAERSRAEAARYVFSPPKDTRDNVVTWTQSYNQAVRDRCGRAASP